MNAFVSRTMFFGALLTMVAVPAVFAEVCELKVKEDKATAHGSRDQTIKIWDFERRREVLTLRDHTAPVKGVAFSTDGKRLVSASADGTLKVFDARSGQWPGR